MPRDDQEPVANAVFDGQKVIVSRGRVIFDVAERLYPLLTPVIEARGDGFYIVTDWLLAA